MDKNKFLKENHYESEYKLISEEKEEPKKDNREIKEIYAFAHMMNRSGRMFNDEDIKMQCEIYLINYDKVKKIFHKVFDNNKDAFDIDNKPAIDQTIVFMKSRWDFKKNEITGNVEYSKKNDYDFEICNPANIKVALEKSGSKYPMEGVKTILNSDVIESYDPFKEYFNNLPKWDGFDHIDHITKFVKTEDDEFFRTMFKKMLVRTVRCSIDEKYVNRYIFILSSEKQDTGKTKFISQLNPMGSQYFKIFETVKGKDSTISLSENFIINFDEIDKMERKDIGILKQMISLESIKERRPYQTHEVYMPRRASFFGTTNHDDILTDVSNTRYIIVKTISFEWRKYYKYNFDLLWAQAKYLLESEFFEYELTDDEKKFKEEQNKDYAVESIEKDLIKTFLKPHKTSSNEFMTCAEILTYLEAKSGAKLSAWNLWRDLPQLGFLRRQIKNDSGMSVKGYICERNENILEKGFKPPEKLF